MEFNGEEEKEVLLDYRLTYLADSLVNGVKLGTVLANDEVVNGLSVEEVFNGAKNHEAMVYAN